MIETNYVKIPKLRFHEFNDEWQIKKLGDIGENIIGLTYSPKNVTKNTQCPIVLRSSNIKNDSLKFEDIVRVNLQIKAKLFVKVNDILICTRNGSQRLIGKNVLIKSLPQPITFGAFMSVYRSSVNDFNIFLFKSSRYNKQIQMNLGARINQITTSYLNRFKFYYPSREEQQKIAGFLTTVDDKCSILQQKIDLLKKYKNGASRAIFTQKLRFKDVNGNLYSDWQEKRLGDLFEITSSKRVYEADWRSAGIPFYRTREILNLIDGRQIKSPIYITKELFKKYTTKYGEISRGDMLVTGVGTIGKIYVVNGDRTFYFKDGNVIWLKNNPKHCSDFIYYSFQTKYIQKQINDNASITTVGTYTIDDAKKTKILLPVKEEQQKIANFLTVLDDKIKLEESKLEQAKKFKKALLQQMFI